jgi:endonuclease/exonuclease/phosphatase family metal-dependent hydrolase
MSATVRTLSFTLVVLSATLLAACKRSQPPVPASQPAARTDAASKVGGPATQSTRPAIVLGRKTDTFIDREDPLDLRLVSYNVNWNSIFEDVNAVRAAKFARVIVALNPDVLALQEIGLAPTRGDQPAGRKRTAEDVSQLLSGIAPLPNGGTWHACQGKDCVIASKYALKMTAERMTPAGERELALALVDLPDEDFGMDLYVLNNHYKCCDPEKNDALRQQQSDAIVAWLRDARTPGGNIDLPERTAIAIVGDFNIVGSVQPVQTLIAGDIVDEGRYGPDAPPDWDGTALVDAHPLHDVAGPEDWTWRDDKSAFPPGRLDYVFYTDSIFDAARKFALNTTIMSAEELQAAGLEKYDTALDDEGKVYDHLPLVVDFRPTLSAMTEPVE